MIQCNRLLCAWGLVVALASFGCRQQAEPVTPKKPSSSPPPSVRREVPGYAQNDLSDITGYLPVLDDGRLKVALPIQWRMEPRSRDYVVRFRFDQNRQLPLPRITIHARDVVEGEPDNLTKDGLAGYIEVMAGQMEEKQRAAIVGQINPLMLGNIPCARYVTPRSFRLGKRVIPGDREVVQTIRGGRVYTILLDVTAGTLIDYRGDAYAVVAWMQFPAVEAAEAKAAKKGTGAEETDKGSDGSTSETSEEKQT